MFYLDVTVFLCVCSAPSGVVCVQSTWSSIEVMWHAPEAHGAPVHEYTLAMADPTTKYGLI